MTIRPITSGIFAIEGLKMGRAYLVEDAGGVTLIDTSSPSATEGILAAIAEIGRKPEDLHTIVGTHYHFDHVGNVAALVARTGAAFCVHEADVEYVEGRTRWKAMSTPVIGARLDRMAPPQESLKVTRVLHDGDIIDAAGGLEVIHAPGHTPGHIALYAKERETVFSADTFMNVAGLQLPASGSTHDMTQAKASIRRLAELRFEYALPGHGAPMLSRASEKLGEWARRWLL